METTSRLYEIEVDSGSFRCEVSVTAYHGDVKWLRIDWIEKFDDDEFHAVKHDDLPNVAQGEIWADAIRQAADQADEIENELRELEEEMRLGL